MRSFWIAVASFMLTFAAVSSVRSAPMEDESDKAHVGHASRSSGITFAPAVELALEHAQARARSTRSPVVTTEHALIELLEEDTARELLSVADVDLDALRADLQEALGSDSPGAPAASEPRASNGLQDVLRRAVVAALASGSRGASGADVIVAILVEGESEASRLLSKHGLTTQAAENEKIEQYLRRSKQQAEHLAIVAAQARLHRESTAGIHSKGHHLTTLGVPSKENTGTDSATRGDQSAHKSFLLRISSNDQDRSRIPFKAALSRNGLLDLYVEHTPFEVEFVASTVVGLFEAVEAGDRLTVQLITEVEGEERVVSGFGGAAGAIFRDARDRLGQRAGILD